MENTEHSNGIIQDEPEVIMQSVDTINILFQRIKTATPAEANVYCDVLREIAKDLVPPNEILTKVIKELLTTNQPHCEIIAKIVFQVVRSAIDSSYLPLLQDWLICTLPNFLSLQLNKALWSLTLIFLSASINVHLVKLFPEILPMSFADTDANEERCVVLFTLATQDFYGALTSVEQRVRFKEIIQPLSNAKNTLLYSIFKKICK